MAENPWPALAGQGKASHFARPDLVIPRQVAREQSLTPFHQARPFYTTKFNLAFASPFICPEMPGKTHLRPAFPPKTTHRFVRGT